MNMLISLWKFARPHTIIGTITSVSALFIIATGQFVAWPKAFWISLISAVSCNIFITGYNQLVDVRLDKINKPYLPLASGEMSIIAGKRIVWSALIISLATAWLLSTYFFVLILLIAAIGFLYSWKAVYLKRHHRLAAGAIILVRGILINAGFYLYYSGYEADLNAISNPIWLLIIFVTLFSLGISWFKDIPDVVGDKTEKVASLAIKIGSQRAFNYGVMVVAIGYTLTAFVPLFVDMDGLNPGTLTVGSAIAGFIFLGMVSRVKPENQNSIKTFYLTFWGLFVVEYLIFAIAAI